MMNAALKPDAFDTPRLNIDTSALLVEVSISLWTARKLDRSVTDEVNHDKKASKAAARVNKNLLADRPELEEIQKLANSARSYVYTHTLPWSDSGLRLLPTMQFMKFNERMADFEAEFDEKVKQFVTKYPSLITAQAMALGDMFNRDEYPTPETIERKFGFRTSYVPVPDAGDFRIDVGNAARAQLAEQLERISQERVANAVADIRGRLRDHLMRMSDRLTSDTDDKTGEPKARRFHASLIDTAYDLVELTVSLNITQEPSLERARKGLEMALAGANAYDIRENYELREKVKAGVDNVLREFG